MLIPGRERGPPERYCGLIGARGAERWIGVEVWPFGWRVGVSKWDMVGACGFVVSNSDSA